MNDPAQEEAFLEISHIINTKKPLQPNSAAETFIRGSTLLGLRSDSINDSAIGHRIPSCASLTRTIRHNLPCLARQNGGRKSDAQLTGASYASTEWAIRSQTTKRPITLSENPQVKHILLINADI